MSTKRVYAQLEIPKDDRKVCSRCEKNEAEADSYCKPCTKAEESTSLGIEDILAQNKMGIVFDLKD